MSNIVSTDPLADMLARIRNAIAVGKREVSLPYSSVKAATAELLKASQFIDGVQVNGEGITKTLALTLYGERESARLTSIKRLSKPGRRHYVGAEAIPVVKRGRGIVIVSTSKGLMTGDDAKAQHIGGELICEVY